MRVLIVDDNASMRNLLTALLTSQSSTAVGALEDGNGVMASVLHDFVEMLMWCFAPNLTRRAKADNNRLAS